MGTADICNRQYTSFSTIPSATKTTGRETIITFDLVIEQHEWWWWWRWLNHILTKEGEEVFDASTSNNNKKTDR